MVEIIRNMIVADRGKARQFVKGVLPEGVPADTLGRLRRAGALGPEVEAVIPVSPVTKGKAK